MKVLLITTHLETGGIGIYTANLARYLAKKDVEVIVASSGGELVNLLISDNIRHIDLDIRTKAEFGIKTWKSVPKVLKMVKDNNVDVIHAQTRVSQVISCMVSRLSKVPYVTTCHGFYKRKRLGRRFFPCWGDKVIAISNSVEEHLIHDFGVGPDCISMIYNGIETDRFNSQVGKDENLKRSLGLNEREAVIGSVGRLSRVKGYKYLISAFKDVVSKHKQTKLLLVGEGPEKNNLEKIVKDLDLSENVIITSGRDQKIEKYFAIIDVFCLPSLHEGLGLSLMEAMASRKSCIATRVGGLKELIVDRENGLLVPKEDPKALCEAMLKLIEDGPLRDNLALKAEEKALNDFKIQESVLKTIKVYEEVTA